jgi:hypothetical protein
LDLANYPPSDLFPKREENYQQEEEEEEESSHSQA